MLKKISLCMVQREINLFTKSVFNLVPLDFGEGLEDGFRLFSLALV
jgi:hypothetical protein